MRVSPPDLHTYARTVYLGAELPGIRSTVFFASDGSPQNSNYYRGRNYQVIAQKTLGISGRRGAVVISVVSEFLSDNSVSSAMSVWSEASSRVVDEVRPRPGLCRRRGHEAQSTRARRSLQHGGRDSRETHQ